MKENPVVPHPPISTSNVQVHTCQMYDSVCLIKVWMCIFFHLFFLSLKEWKTNYCKWIKAPQRERGVFTHTWHVSQSVCSLSRMTVFHRWGKIFPELCAVELRVFSAFQPSWCCILCKNNYDFFLRNTVYFTRTREKEASSRFELSNLLFYRW